MVAFGVGYAATPFELLDQLPVRSFKTPARLAPTFDQVSVGGRLLDVGTYTMHFALRFETKTDDTQEIIFEVE